MADIATAFLRLRADGSGFREEADATVRKSTSGLKAKVPLAVDDKSATASLDRMKARLADLRGKVTTVTLDANDKAARVRLAKLAVSLNDLGRKVISPEIDIDGVTKAEAQLLALTHQFGKLRDKAAGAAVAETASSLAGLAGSAASSVASVGASAAAIGSLV